MHTRNNNKVLIRKYSADRYVVIANFLTITWKSLGYVMAVTLDIKKVFKGCFFFFLIALVYTRGLKKLCAFILSMPRSITKETH